MQQNHDSKYDQASHPPILSNSDGRFYTRQKICYGRLDNKIATCASTTARSSVAAGWATWVRRGSLVTTGTSSLTAPRGMLDVMNESIYTTINALALVTDYTGHDQTSRGPSNGPETRQPSRHSPVYTQAAPPYRTSQPQRCRTATSPKSSIPAHSVLSWEVPTANVEPGTTHAPLLRSHDSPSQWLLHGLDKSGLNVSNDPHLSEYPSASLEFRSFLNGWIPVR